MTPIQRFLAHIDRRYQRRYRLRCRSRFGRQVEGELDGRRYELRKCDDGSYRFLRDGEDLPSLAPDHCSRREMEHLRNLLLLLQHRDRIEVRFANVTYRLEIGGRGGPHQDRQEVEPGLVLEVMPPRRAGRELPLDPRRQKSLQRYLALLRDERQSLARILARINAQQPEELALMDLVWDSVFENGSAFVKRECRLSLSTTCNQRCRFCCALGESAPLPFAQAIGALEAIDRRAADHRQQVTLSFTGGEPTLHPQLPQLVARTRDLGLGTIGLQTNGVRLEQRSC